MVFVFTAKLCISSLPQNDLHFGECRTLSIGDLLSFGSEAQKNVAEVLH